MGAAVHNPAHPSLGQIAGRMLAGEHDVDEDAQGIDVRTDIRLDRPYCSGAAKPVVPRICVSAEFSSL